jgi:hypothetical protein
MVCLHNFSMTANLQIHLLTVLVEINQLAGCCCNFFLFATKYNFTKFSNLKL